MNEEVRDTNTTDNKEIKKQTPTANVISFKPKKYETSKVVLCIVLFICFVFASIILYGWLILELPDAPLMLTAVLTPAGTSIGFYYWKAKAEANIKLQAVYGKLHIPEHLVNQYQYGGYGNYGGYNSNMVDNSYINDPTNGVG